MKCAFPLSFPSFSSPSSSHLLLPTLPLSALPTLFLPSLYPSPFPPSLQVLKGSFQYWRKTLEARRLLQREMSRKKNTILTRVLKNTKTGKVNHINRFIGESTNMFLLCVMLLCVMCCTDRALVVVCVICAVAVLRSV